MKNIIFAFVTLAGLSSSAALIPELPADGAKEQLDFYLDAANHGSPRAMLALAHYNEHGIGMPTNRAEALRWYRQVLSSRSGSVKAVIEAAESGLVRLGGDTIQFDETSTSGNYFLDLIAAQTNRESAVFACNALRHKLLGRTLVFTNLVTTYVQRRKDGIVKLMLDLPREPFVRRDDPHAYRPRDYSFMTTCVFFDPADARVARCLDRDDKIVRVEGLVVTNWTWQNGMALKGVSVEPADPAIETPIPAFDAAAITGDELVAFLNRQRHIRKWQIAEIQSKLAGRRLTFHRLRLSGSNGSRGNALVSSDSSFWLGAVPIGERVGEGDLVGRASFMLYFSNDSARQFAHRLLRTDAFSVIDELVGTFAKVENGDDIQSLRLEDVTLVPKGAMIDLADDGKGPLSGDELVRKVGTDFTAITKLGLCSRFEGREISFTSGVIESSRTDWDNGTITVTCRMAPQTNDNGRRHPLHVSFTVSPEKTKSLRRTPIRGDLVIGLKGRLAGFAPENNGKLTSHYSFGEAYTLELKKPEFDVLWKSDVAKLTGLETKAGERIVRRLGLCWPDVRADQLLRLARQVNGRTVDFPRAVIHNTDAKPDGTAFVTVGLVDPLLGECSELTLVVPKGKLAEQVSVLKYGIRLQNIRGTLVTELAKPNDWQPKAMCARLKNATFEIVPSQKR